MNRKNQTNDGKINGWSPVMAFKEPNDERAVEVMTYDGFKFIASFKSGFMTSDEEDCRCWVAENDDCPEDWTDGICWESNENENQSDPVIAYRELPNVQ